jgi:sulfur-oxidizing protein SoxB
MVKKMTIVQVNYMHAYLKSHSEFFYSANGISFSQAGGYARIKTLFDHYQKQGPTLILDNGDTIHGTYEVVQEKGWNMVPILNQMGIQAMTFHWDIGYGPENLKQIGKELNYPILAINCYEEKTNNLYFEPYHIFNVGGLSVGVIGIACNIIDKTMPDSFSEGVYFTLGNEELPAHIKTLKNEGVDLIVVLSHLGFPQDYKLMSEVEGVDICLSGHTHNRLEKSVQINDTTIIQSGHHGSFIGVLEVSIGEKVQVTNHQLLPINDSIPENNEIKQLVEKAVSPYNEFLDQVVGETAIDIFRGLSSVSNMDNFLLEAVIHDTKADAAFSNGWRYGAPIEKGTITMRDLYQIVPMNPPISLAELTGAEIVEMIEENLENNYSDDPFDQMGGYVKRSYGIRTYLKVENPKGTRVVRLYVGEKEVNLDKIYKVAYITKQGVPKKCGQNHRHTGKKVIEVMIDYLKENGPYDSKLEGIFTLV